ARTTSPDAVTSSTESRLSQTQSAFALVPADAAAEGQAGNPGGGDQLTGCSEAVCVGCGVETRHVTPPPARARRLSGSTSTVFMRERSRTNPPSHVENPAKLYPPPRTA